MITIPSLFASIQELRHTPYALPLIVLFTTTILLIIAAFLFTPLYFALMFTVVFVGMSVGAIQAYARLAKTEIEARLGAQQLKAVTQDMYEGVVVYTPQFKIININPAAEKILNITEKDVLGKIITPQSAQQEELSLFTQVIYPSLAPTINNISEGGWPQVTEIGTQAPERRLRLTLNQLLDGKRVTGFVKIIQDKTHEQQLEESKTEFITNSAHQLRTPLTGINWAFESLRSALKENKELSDTAEQGYMLAQRGLRIINEMLDVAQIEGGTITYSADRIDINELVSEVLQEARPVAKSYNITIHSSLSTEHMYMNGDRERLRAALITLIDNAIKYNNEDGSVTITTSKQESLGNITIQDTGVGIPETEQKHLFEKFYRGEHAKKIDPNGSGLGLFIVKNIIERHKGKVWAESTPGRGSTFYLSLPLAESGNPPLKSSRPTGTKQEV